MSKRKLTCHWTGCHKEIKNNEDMLYIKRDPSNPKDEDVAYHWNHVPLEARKRFQSNREVTNG